MELLYVYNKILELLDEHGDINDCKVADCKTCEEIERNRAKYYQLLKLKRVTNFKMQEEFILQDKFKIEGKTRAAIKYKPDFTFYDEKGNLTVFRQKSPIFYKWVMNVVRYEGYV